MSNPPALEVRGLRVEYPGVVAVDRLDLTLMPGDVCALIGRNGAGKTSTLRCIASRQRPTDGRVTVCGVAFDDDPYGYRRHIGWMGDEPALHAALTVAEFLDHHARLYEVKDADHWLMWCLDQVGLADKLHTRCKALSRGMRQRLTLACALVHRPPLLLLDEPASGLDPMYRERLTDLFSELSRRGIAIVVSSHVLSEVSRYATHAVVLDDGVVTVSGPIDELRGGEAVARYVRWRPDGASALSVLEPVAEASVERIETNAVTFTWHGDERDLAALLGRLVAAGVLVDEWRPARDALADLLTRTPLSGTSKES